MTCLILSVHAPPKTPFILSLSHYKVTRTPGSPFTFSSARSVSQDYRGKKNKHKPLYSRPLLFSWNLPSDQEQFQLSSLEPSHAALVNQLWQFGGNERSQRFIERCIRNFPSVCLLGPEGTPIAWSLMDQTGEMRMAGTKLEYRAQGLVTYVIFSHSQVLTKLGFPSYSHVDKRNKIMQKMSHTLNHLRMPCSWNQWNCVPL